MEVLQIDITGKLAHFRKYYANNTAMSFSIPPRTTVIGMLAGILGRPRDTYYEEFGSDRIRIGMSVLTPLKKTFHRLNMLSVKGKGDLNGSGGRIQTPFEVVSGFDISRDLVTYRVFVSCTDSGVDTFEALKMALLLREHRFALTFGTANFTASVSAFSIYKRADIQEITPIGWVSIHSVVPSRFIEKIDFDPDRSPDSMEMIEEELLPADFVANQNRELKKMVRALFSTSSKEMRLQLNSPYYRLSAGEDNQHIVFIE